MAPEYQIREVTLRRQPTAVMRGEMPPDQLSRWLPGCYSKVASYLNAAGVPMVGPPFARFTFLADVVAVEAGFPCAEEVPGDGEVEPSVLPAGPAVITTHVGRYEDLADAHQAVHAWLASRSLVEARPHWEVYFTDPAAEPDPRRWRTDVVAPYRAA